MKNRFYRMGITLLGATCLLSTCGITSCQDTEFDTLENTLPSDLKASIYDELKNNGTFTTEVRLIDDLDYADVLAKTGSKTLFVANDDAFAQFFKTTNWKDGNGNPIRSYEQLSMNQKRLLLNGSMLNNAYVMEMLSNTAGTAGKNLCLRQGTNASATDSIAFWHYYELPQMKYVAEEGESSNSANLRDVWSWYRTQEKGGIYMATDGTNPMMTHFLEGQMKDKNIKHSDITFLLNQPVDSWPEDGGDRSYIYNRQVTEQDVTCLNGYYHVLDAVLVTPPSMAEVIRQNEQTSLFSEMLERFSIPMYNAQLTAEYQQLHQSLNVDSVFTKKYIATNTSLGAINNDLNNRSLGEFPKLSYDPGWNAYAISSTTVKENDMGAMFVPSNAALESYFLEGAGTTLMNRYAKQKPVTRENLSFNVAQIPLNVVAALINNLMKDSFNETVPSKYLTIMNDAQDQMFDNYATEADYRAAIDSVVLANNGVVYIMNTVISPADYSSVAAPVLLSNNTRIVNSVLRADEAYIDGSLYNSAPLKQYFSTYLKAMQSRFTFFVPTDDGLGLYGYVDPVSIASAVPANYRYWRFEYEESSSRGSAASNTPRLPIRATAYKYNVETGPTEADEATGARYVHLPTASLTSDYGPTKRELMIEMVNQHILIHDNDDTQGVNSGRRYFTSRSGAPLYIKKQGNAAANGEGMQIEGGLQLNYDTDEFPANDHFSTVTSGYDMTRETNSYGNGMTYLIDRPVQPTMNSVFHYLSTDPNFSEFYALCDPNNFSEDLLIIAGLKDSITGKRNERDLWSAERNKYIIFTNLEPNYPAAGDYLVRFFNNYRYTIYVPTNEAVLDAINNKNLPTWQSINLYVDDHKDADGKLSDEDKAKVQAMLTCLINFIKYHFQDQAFYVDNVTDSGTYQTSCIDNVANAYLNITVNQTAGAMRLTDEAGTSHQVIAPYNLLARDMNFNASPTNVSSARYVKNSSYAAIHQVDGVLNFTALGSGGYDQFWASAAKARKFAAKYRLKK